MRGAAGERVVDARVRKEDKRRRDEREEGLNASVRVRGCIDTSLRRWFVIL